MAFDYDMSEKDLLDLFIKDGVLSKANELTEAGLDLGGVCKDAVFFFPDDTLGEMGYQPPLLMA